MYSEMVYRISLTLVPLIGPVQARQLIEAFGSASAIFNARLPVLEKANGMGAVRAKAIRQFSQFGEAERELEKLTKYNIRALFLTDKDYPARLLNCYDPPTLLYYRGQANLNASRVVAVVGTRRNTAQGKWLTEELLRGLMLNDTLIISGLAYGIDAIAHRQALQLGLPTVGVLGHGLDQMYPPGHGALARDILLDGGGLLSEFRLGTKPDKHHFPIRNRLVAGMSDAVVVIESGIKGGSMVTADLAAGYNRDVFAFPGRVTDDRSAGCLQLIRQQKAQLICNANDLRFSLGWNTRAAETPVQRTLFVNLSSHEEALAKLFQQNNILHRDELNTLSGLSNSQLAAAMLSLELKGLLCALPGNRYRLET